MKRKFTFLSAALVLLVCLAIPMGVWGQTRDDVTESYGWEDSDDATAWTITEAITKTSGQGNTGTYAGKINTNHTYVQFNEKVYVKSFSFAFKRTSTNSNYNVYIETSTDGSNWTAVETYAMGSFANGSYTTKTHEFDGTTEYFVRFHCYNTTAVRYVDDVTITYSTGAASLNPSDFSLNNSELSFDLYDNADAQVINYSTSSTGAVTVTENEYITAVVDETNKTITVTPLLVTQSTQTITVNQAADENYASGTATFTVDIADSTPFTGGDVTFKASEDKDLNNTSQGEGSITKNGVTFACNNGILGNGTEYRLYKNSETTFSTSEGTITQIVFTQSGSYSISNLEPNVGSLSDNTWTGNSASVTFTASNQARATQIIVTVNMSGTPDPLIVAENVSIGYGVTSGEITYTIENEVTGGSLTAATESGWLTLGIVGDNIPFTCTVNEAGAERTATVTLTYTYNRETVTKDVTVTQAANPNATLTIAEVRAQGTGSVVTKGVVTSCVGTTGYIQDATAAICVYGEELTVGDEIKVSGTLTTYKGLLELTNPEVTVLSQNNTVEPEEMTIAAINANTNTNQGWYVRIEEATITEIGTNSNYTIAQGENTITLHGDLGEVEVSVNDIISVSGNIGCYNTVQIVNPQNVEVQVVPSIIITPATLDLNATGDNGYQHETLNLTYENIEIVNYQSFTVQFYDAEGEEQEQPAWIVVGVAGTNADGYQVQCVVPDNDGEARTAYFKVHVGDTYSNLVTVNQAAYVAPAQPGNWVLTELADLTAGDVFVIVGTNDLGEHYYAMSNDKGTLNPPTAVAVTVADNTLSGEIADNLQWNLTASNSGYTFYPAGSASTWLYCTNGNNGVRVGTNNNSVFVMDGGYLKHVATSRFVGIYNSQDWRCYTSNSGSSNIAGQTFAFYKKVSDDVTYNKTVTAYEGDGGYVLIASPVCSVTPSSDNGFLTSEYDLYYFDQSEDQEWRNYETIHFNLESGKGYLYASSTDTQLTFTGQPYNGNGVVALDYDADAALAGWNLVGNPFDAAATCSKAFYRLNSDGSEVNAETETGSIAAMEGVFVVAEATGETVTFTKGGSAKAGEMVVMNVTHNRGNVIDRAIVRFDEGSQLPKFQLFQNSTKLYIPQGDNDYAIVRSANQGEMPVNFKARENGTYTISVNTENVEMDYLHLIDNKTGMDVDLLQTPSYTFEATTRDYASRFRLVFSANDNNAEGNAHFAYFNGSEWQISNTGEATLQVVDVMGRIVKNVAIEDNATVSINEMPGIYMMRLINGNDVKVQKIVVR